MWCTGEKLSEDFTRMLMKCLLKEVIHKIPEQQSVLMSNRHIMHDTGNLIDDILDCVQKPQ
jgi:hypothetical protein